MFLVLSVLLYIGVASAPADIDTMVIEVRDEVAVMTRNPSGGWHAHDPVRNGGFDVAVDGNALVVSTAQESDHVDIGPHIVGLAGIDWTTATELRTPVAEARVHLERDGNQLTVARTLDGERAVLGTIRFGEPRARPSPSATPPDLHIPVPTGAARGVESEPTEVPR